jgi:hypothetical protein
MTVILANRNINISINKLWEIISDVDNDSQYWHGIRSIKNIKKEHNIIERETTISFKNKRCREVITLEPNKEYQLNIQIIEGPIIGKKIITLEKIAKNNTKINVRWDIHLNGMARFFTIFIKKHILKGTEEALERITRTAIERTTEKKL